MDENKYFKQALSNFAFETASGGAIRRLSDKGYTVKQITEMLDFPTPYARVQETVWKHMVEKGQILLEEPGHVSKKEKVEYIQVRDKYGKTSFCQVKQKEADEAQIQWKECSFDVSKDGMIRAFLAQKCRENGEESAYVSCNFGVRLLYKKEKFEKELECLEKAQKEYILGLPWERKVVYHRLDQRMCEIVARLYEQGLFQGECWFMKTAEKIILQVQ